MEMTSAAEQSSMEVAIYIKAVDTLVRLKSLGSAPLGVCSFDYVEQKEKTGINTGSLSVVCGFFIEPGGDSVKEEALRSTCLSPQGFEGQCMGLLAGRTYKA